MDIKEIFEKFEANAAYTFSTIDDGYPETRIAHFLMYDEDGLYFQTMKVKPFYKQLKEQNTVAVCSLVSEQGAATHDQNGLPNFNPGHFIKLSGDCKELTMQELKDKANKNEKFIPLINDIKRYPTMTTFVLYRFKGEVFDYDFAKEHRDHKIERERFSFGGMKFIPSGMRIKSNCISCGRCKQVCTFDAIDYDKSFSINGNRCDECGSCYAVCPVNAIESKCDIDENERQLIANGIIK